MEKLLKTGGRKYDVDCLMIKLNDNIFISDI